MYIRSQARSLFKTNFLNKKDKIVKEYDPVILYTQPPGKRDNQKLKIMFVILLLIFIQAGP